MPRLSTDEGGGAPTASARPSAAGRWPLAMGTAVAVIALTALTALMAAPAAIASPVANPGAPVVINSRSTALGTVLVDSGGFSLYDFSGDGAPFLSCLPTNTQNGAPPCPVVWPPLVATGPLVAGPGVNQKGLGQETRPGPNGSTIQQVTYFGQPLYRFMFDTAPHQTNGEDVTSFLGFWRLVSVDGRPAADQATARLELSPNGPVLAAPVAFGFTRSLYHLTTDPPRTTKCTGACAAVWPPVLSDEMPKSGPGIDSGALGLLRRPDGTHQVTYFGQPLYMFAFDLGALAPSGQTNGDNFIDPFAFGVWYTLSPTGRPDPGAVSVQTESSPLGTILATSAASPFNPGATTATVYAFSADTATKSNCDGRCARIWPPLLTSQPPVAGPGATPGLIGSIQRGDGSFQITYNSHPLYLFSQALDPSTAGEGKGALFGGTFHALTPAGAPA